MNAPTDITDLGHLLQDFFCSYLIEQRRVSKHTVSAYRDAFKLLLPFLTQKLNKPIATLALVDLNAETIITFLQYLEEERHNKVQTRNARLAAIHAFMNYAAAKAPQALASIQQVLAIPQKRADQFSFEYLEKYEMEALLKGFDLTNWFGERDHALFEVLYNTGARVSEVAIIQVKDIDLSRQQVIHFHGKGRKERIVPLLPETVKMLRQWMTKVCLTPESPVFPNRYGLAISRHGVTQRLKCALKRTTKICPSLKGRKITPHTFRHTTAMHLLQSGVDLTVIALWLGHENIDTTHEYMKADLEMKRKALSMLTPVDVRGTGMPVKVTEDVLAFLESL